MDIKPVVELRRRILDQFPEILDALKDLGFPNPTADVDWGDVRGKKTFKGEPEKIIPIITAFADQIKINFSEFGISVDFVVLSSQASRLVTVGEEEVSVLFEMDIAQPDFIKNLKIMCAAQGSLLEVVSDSDDGLIEVIGFLP